ncbi:unnamed protein product [Gongylonema pulchrum]|uniref:DUF4915 domain-containing protein n=1 Tax=Gongylonema pulchrum TaxID=637853 RepID=A0A183D1W8_9BILA|nr:unnamed protein product [Gongylonema pulchrum]
MQFGNCGPDDNHLYYPKKALAYESRIGEGGYIVVDRGETKARMQLFSKRGEFIPSPAVEYVSAMTMNDSLNLVVFTSLVKMYFLDIDQLEPLVLRTVDCSKFIGEPSDVAFYRNRYFVTDYKHHCVASLNAEGELLCRFGSYETTPYPIGIDVSQSGDVLVSRCVGLRLTAEGFLVSVSKHNHTLLIFSTIFVNPSNISI